MTRKFNESDKVMSILHDYVKILRFPIAKVIMKGKPLEILLVQT